MFSWLFPPGMTFACRPLLLAPLLVLFFYIMRSEEKRRALFPNLGILMGTGTSLRIKLRGLVLPPLKWLFVITLSIGAARPQLVRYVQQDVQARNIFLVIDISPSMGAQDFVSEGRAANRLAGVKKVVAGFISNRLNDRLGLVAFGGKAFLQCPLTSDRQVILDLASQLQVGMAGDGTAIGDAMGIALKHINQAPEGSRAIILLTDGVSNAGQVNPLKAAKVSRDLGIKIYTIGIGSSEPETVSLPGIFGGTIRRQAEFDEDTLQEIARLTGGEYFNAENEKRLSAVYGQIDRLEGNDREEPEKKIADELFLRFATIALVLYTIYLLLTSTVFMKVP